MFLPVWLNSTEYAPWTERDVEFQTLTTVLYQQYNSVQTSHRRHKYNSNDLFLHLSLAVSYDRYAVELETEFAHTRHQRQLNWDTLALTGRYQILNDILGDPVSLFVGAQIRQVLRLALNDVSCFYHGGLQGEFHAALGKETSCSSFWRMRTWGVVAFGLADHGSPYLKAKCAWESNWWDLHRAQLFLDTLWGFGKRGLRLHHFRGYGPVRHDSVDLGGRYTYMLPCGGASLSLGYAYRIFAQNYPRGVNHLWVELYYPFGL